MWKSLNAWGPQAPTRASPLSPGYLLLADSATGVGVDELSVLQAGCSVPVGWEPQPLHDLGQPPGPGSSVPGWSPHP